MDKGEGNLKLLRKTFEKSIDREVIESVFNSVDSNYKSAHAILMDMLKTTENYNAFNSNVDAENSKTAKGIWAEPNNIRNPTKVNGNHNKDNSNNNCPKPPPRNNSKKELAKIGTIQLIKGGCKVMVLLRGIPGSGKSYLAKEIVQEVYGTTNYSDYIFSADDYFSLSGRYRYVREKISEAHAWNQNRALLNVRSGLSPIIIDNTNVKIWEMKIYVQMAIEHGYYIQVLEPATPWAFNHHELAKRNKHDVPREKIRDMLESYDYNVTTEMLLSMFGLRYASDMQPPQQRLRPPVEIPVINEGREGVKKTVVKEFQKSANCVMVNNNLIDLDSIPLPPSPTPSSSRKPILNTDSNLYAWGLTQNALNSWNMVEALQHGNDVDKPSTSFKIPSNETRLIVRDSSTNTSSRDFAMAQTGIQDGSGHNMMTAFSRDITKGISAPIVPQRKNGNRVTTFEKGIMTTSDNDVPIDIGASESGLATLRNLFSDIPLEYLRDVYEKCQRNTNWAVDLLLDDNREILAYIPSIPPVIINKSPPQTVIKQSDVDSNLDNESTSPKPMEAEIIDLLDDSTMSDCEPSPKRITSNTGTIKKQIESVVQIGSEFYSDHLLNLKSLRKGTSSQYSKSAVGRCNEVAKDQINNYNMNYDMDIDDFEMEQVMKTVPAMTDNVEDLVELNLGVGLVRQLETQFGDPHLIYPDGLLPTIQVPVSFARQLHAFYLESIFEQLENQQAIYEELCKEDEVFAKKLQDEENRKLLEMRGNQQTEQSVPQLAEIMQEQAAQKDFYQSKLSADDLASRLTRQKLFDNFPSVSEETMLDIFAAHDNNYVKTVEVLLNTGLSMVNADEFPLQPPVEEHVVKEMKQAEENLIKNKQQHNKEIVQSADEYRKLAMRHATRRNELMSHAQSYHRKGMGAVAMFYSRLAREESELFDQTNARAAECFLQEHSSRLDKFDTIDLHYLQSKEVGPALDIFLDRHINLLHGPNSKRTETLYVITGRGKHSKGGVSVIKPIVMNRLTKRQIGYTLMNPGLLQITVKHNSPITSDLR